MFVCANEASFDCEDTLKRKSFAETFVEISVI